MVRKCDNETCKNSAFKLVEIHKDTWVALCPACMRHHVHKTYATKLRIKDLK